MRRNMLDVKILGALIIIIALGAILGVLVYNNMDPETTGICKPLIGLDNQTTVNNTTDNNYFTSNSLFNLNSYSRESNGHSKPSPTPKPKPDPTPDPMDRVISLFDAYLNSLFPKSGVPGAAVIIVQNNEIIYMNTLGVKNLGSGEPVDENTLFGIGSSTKPFAATNIAQFVSAGLMSWDDPISKYYNVSEFQLYSDYVTSNITIRDCLSHRSGLPGYSPDFTWMTFNDSYPDILYKLRYMKNDTQFRSAYQYNNILYALPSFSAAKISNTSWSELIKTELLEPLGMNQATVTMEDFFNSPNHATPYRAVNGTLKEWSINLDSIGPSGVLASSISEMAHWLKFQVAGTGYYNGVQLTSKSALDETRTAHINIAPNVHYGLGWGIYDGVLLHSGDTGSSGSYMSIFPSDNLGFAVLSTGGQYGYALNSALFYKLADLIKGDEITDPWVKPDINSFNSSPSPWPLSTFTGVYLNSFYGNINVTTYNDTLFCYYGTNKKGFELIQVNDSEFVDPYNFEVHLNFTDIYDDKFQKLNITISDYSTAPATDYSIFNRTNSTS